MFSSWGHPTSHNLSFYAYNYYKTINYFWDNTFNKRPLVNYGKNNYSKSFNYFKNFIFSIIIYDRYLQDKSVFKLWHANFSNLFRHKSLLRKFTSCNNFRSSFVNF